MSLPFLNSAPARLPDRHRLVGSGHFSGGVVAVADHETLLVGTFIARVLIGISVT